MFPATYKFSPIPTPPVTTNAPDVLLVAHAELVTCTIPVALIVPSVVMTTLPVVEALPICKPVKFPKLVILA